MDAANNEPSDAIVKVVVDVVEQVKSRGHFDTLRRNCLTGMENDAVYFHLLQKVENFTARFLSKQRWHPQMNKSHLREQLREELTKAHFIQTGVRNIVEHIINKKRLQRELYPIIESLIYEHFDIQPPSKTSTNESKFRPVTSVTTHSTRLSNVHSYDSPSTSIEVLKYDLDNETNGKHTMENNNKTITMDLIATSRADDDTPVQDETNAAALVASVNDDDDVNVEMMDEKPAEPSCSTTTQFEQIDVDEGAELSVQCFVTQLTPERDETSCLETNNNGAVNEGDDGGGADKMEELYFETSVEEQLTTVQQIDGAEEQKIKNELKPSDDDEDGDNDEEEKAAALVNKQLKNSDDAAASNEFVSAVCSEDGSLVDVELEPGQQSTSGRESSDNDETTSSRPRTRPSNKKKVGMWKHLSE